MTARPFPSPLMGEKGVTCTWPQIRTWKPIERNSGRFADHDSVPLRGLRPTGLSLSSTLRSAMGSPETYKIRNSAKRALQSDRCSCYRAIHPCKHSLGSGVSSPIIVSCAKAAAFTSVLVVNTVSFAQTRNMAEYFPADFVVYSGFCVIRVVSSSLYLRYRAKDPSLSAW